MPFQRILLPVDFSDASRAALEWAAKLALDYQGELIVLHAVETLGPENVTYGEAAAKLQPEGYRRRLWEELRRVVPTPGALKVEYLLVEDVAAKVILDVAANRHCDLIVMGSHGRSGIKRLLMGSTAEKVVRRAACPVLVVKSPPSEPATSKPAT